MRHIHQHTWVLSIAFVLAASMVFAQTSDTGGTDKPEIDLFNLEECIPMRIQDGYVIQPRVRLQDVGSVPGQGPRARLIERVVPAAAERRLTTLVLAPAILYRLRCPCHQFAPKPTWGGPADIPQDLIDAHVCIQWGHGDCDNWVQGKAKVSWSIDDDWQGIVGTIFKDNDFDETGDGDIFFEVKHQFHNDADHSAALWGIVANFPTGQDYARIDTTFPGFSFVVNERDDEIDISVYGVYTRILDADERERLHAEIRHTFVRSAPMGFDPNRWFLAVGYDRPVNEKTLGMASIWWEESASQLSDDSFALQLGFRRKESKRFVWGASLNLGLSWKAADWGLTLAGQRRL